MGLPDRVLQGGELRDQLRRLVLLRDGGVLRGEGVAVEAEVADPQLGPEVHLAHGVEDGLAAGAGAHHRVVLDRRQVCM